MPHPLPPHVRPIPNRVEILLKIVPNSSRSVIVGLLGDRLKIKVAAPPEAGKANKEVVAIIRKWTAAADVTVVAGLTNPEKTVRLTGLAAHSFDWSPPKK